MLLNSIALFGMELSWSADAVYTILLIAQAVCIVIIVALLIWIIFRLNQKSEVFSRLKESAEGAETTQSAAGTLGASDAEKAATPGASVPDQAGPSPSTSGPNTAVAPVPNAPATNGARSAGVAPMPPAMNGARGAAVVPMQNAPAMNGVRSMSVAPVRNIPGVCSIISPPSAYGYNSSPYYVYVIGPDGNVRYYGGQR